MPQIVWFATLAILVLVLAAWHWGAGLSKALEQVRDPVSASTSTRPAGQPSSRTPSSSTTVRLGSRPGLDTPAATAAQWRIDDPRFGRISVFVPVGKTPRETLSKALAEHGYQVVP